MAACTYVSAQHTTFDRICGLTTSPPKFEIKYPRYLSAAAHGLIEGMLQPDVTKRVGCMKNGTADIKEHKFFEGFSWDDCANRANQVACPYCPSPRMFSRTVRVRHGITCAIVP